MKQFYCTYVIDGCTGKCHGISVAQLVNRARFDFCRRYQNSNSPNFRLSLAQQHHVKLIPNPSLKARSQELYRMIKDEDKGHAEYEHITNFLRELNENNCL